MMNRWGCFECGRWCEAGASDMKPRDCPYGHFPRWEPLSKPPEMQERIEELPRYGGVMLSSTKTGWCCHVVGRGINRHLHDRTAVGAVCKAFDAMRSGDWNDEE